MMARKARRVVEAGAAADGGSGVLIARKCTTCVGSIPAAMCRPDVVHIRGGHDTLNGRKTRWPTRISTVLPRLDRAYR